MAALHALICVLREASSSRSGSFSVSDSQTSTYCFASSRNSLDCFNSSFTSRTLPYASSRFLSRPIPWSASLMATVWYRNRSLLPTPSQILVSVSTPFASSYLIVGTLQLGSESSYFSGMYGMGGFSQSYAHIPVAWDSPGLAGGRTSSWQFSGGMQKSTVLWNWTVDLIGLLDGGKRASWVEHPLSSSELAWQFLTVEQELRRRFEGKPAK